MASSSSQMSKEAQETVSCLELVEGVYLQSAMPGMVPWEEQISNLRQMKLRSDDIFICAYPKSGTHWLWEVISMLLLGRADYESRPKRQLMLDSIEVSTLDQMPSPRILNTHLPFSMLPVPELKAKEVKVLHIYRNPKDIVVSYYHMNKWWPGMVVHDFKSFFEVFFSDKAKYGNYFDYLKQMNDFSRNNPEVPVMNLSYEDMKKNPVEKVKELAKFLGLDAPDSLCEEIVEACGFANLKKHAYQKTEVIGDKAKKKSRLGGVEVAMYRKGIVGDWKSHLTVAMNERVDQLIKEKTERLPYTLRCEQD